MSKDVLLNKLKNSIIAGDEKEAADVALTLKEMGLPASEIVNKAVKPAMDYVGEKYEKLEFFLPELMVAGDAASAALDVILPKGEMSEATKATVVIGTILGDIHEIGKNIVASILKTNGYNVIDLGPDVHPNRFVAEAKKLGAKFIGVSCLLTPSMYYMRDLIKRLEDEGIRDRFYVIIGGASIYPDWAKEIKADGWAKDAERAVKLCDLLLSKGGSLEKPIIVGE